jgi:hypothetical protein
LPVSIRYSVVRWMPNCLAISSLLRPASIIALAAHRASGVFFNWASLWLSGCYAHTYQPSYIPGARSTTPSARCCI